MYFNYTLLKLYVYANSFFIAQVWFLGRGQLVFWGASKFLGGASKFSNQLAPRATASTSLMSRPAGSMPHRGVLKEKPKLSLVYLCMYYYYISLHNNREIYVQSASTS